MYARRQAAAAAIKLAWSLVLEAPHSSAAAGSSSGGHVPAPSRVCMLAVATKAGIIWLWRCRLPEQYGTQPEAQQAQYEMVSSGLLACPLVV